MPIIDLATVVEDNGEAKCTIHGKADWFTRNDLDQAGYSGRIYFLGFDVTAKAYYRFGLWLSSNWDIQLSFSIYRQKAIGWDIIQSMNDNGYRNIPNGAFASGRELLWKYAVCIPGPGVYKVKWRGWLTVRKATESKQMLQFLPTDATKNQLSVPDVDKVPDTR
ncbi:hypothetical protein [Streptomyces sp. UG1]|uniref:hypothetical protein n=1 Tax=Streptomyces sp. UG1 TaxID=3417652 RepID=UPI003CEC6789